MKHQVFFFVFFFTCSAYAMDVSKVTNDQIANFWIQYGKNVKYHFPNSSYAKKFETVEEDAEKIRVMPLTNKDKKKMVKIIINLPSFAVNEGKIFLIKSDYDANESARSNY